MKKWISVTVAVIIVLGGGIGIYLTTKSSKNNTPQSDASHTDRSNSPQPIFTDACKVISKSAADAAFGLTFQEEKVEGASIGTGSTTSTSCKYNEVTDGSPAAMFKATNLSIEIETYASTDAAISSLKTTRSTDKLGDKVYFIRTDVPGIGDEAFFFQGQAPAVLKTEEYLYTRKENQIIHFVAVRLDGIDHEKARTALTALAKQALN